MAPAHLSRRRTLLAVAAAGAAWRSAPAHAASAGELQQASARAMERFIGHNEDNKAIVGKAVATLVFPEIVKGGLIVGGEYGEGVLRKAEVVAGYYRLIAASLGLQIGGQTYSLAMLFMTEAALRYLDNSDGWQLGSAPNLVVADEKFARDWNTTGARGDVIVFVFGQRGLMAGIDIRGAKISSFTPS